jgi:hypothetical protein
MSVFIWDNLSTLRSNKEQVVTAEMMVSFACKSFLVSLVEIRYKEEGVSGLPQRLRVYELR